MTHQKNGVKKVKVKKQQQPLSQATAQSLLYIVKGEISGIESAIQILNEMIGDYWNASNPSDPETEPYFKALNTAKTYKRTLARRVNRLAKVSKQLKDYTNAS